MRAISVPASILIALASTGCSTHMSTLKYTPPKGGVSNAPQATSIALGAVTDERGTDSNWLGAIRGGYGNPLKKLRTDKPTSEAVAGVIVEALRARNILGTVESSKTAIDVSITKFDCSYYVNREAHAHLNVTLLALPARVPFFAKSYRTDNSESGVGAGIFGDVDHLSNFAQRTLSETIDKVLSDPALIAALSRGPPTQSEGRASAFERIKQLEQLRKEGLITDSEFEAKRKEIIGDL